MMSPPRQIDLNADVGEGAFDDAALFAAGITSANIACGAHAGDGLTMRASVLLARRYGVGLGAHPGYADRAGFGRRDVALMGEALQALLTGQLADLRAAIRAESTSREAGEEGAGAMISHVKPHGALYHYLNRDGDAARRWVEAMVTSAPEAALVGPPRGALQAAAALAGMRFWPEGFIDRAYLPDGNLVPRHLPGAVIADEAEAVAQALRLARAGQVTTLCVHGDGPHAVRLLTATRAALLAEGFTISAPASGR